MSSPFDDSDDFWIVTSHKTTINRNYSKLLIQVITSLSVTFWITLAIALTLPFLYTRLISRNQGKASRDGKRSGIWRVPYWIPWWGNGFFVLWDHEKLAKLRDRSNGLFELRVAGKDVVVVSDGGIIEMLIDVETSNLASGFISWSIGSKIFGLPGEYLKDSQVQAQLDEAVENFVRGPQRSVILNSTIRTVQQNIPQMISFNKAEIDLEPWERSSKVTTTSSSEAEANLMTLIRNMLSHVIIPTVFGTGLLDKFPSIVQDVITLDEGIPFFLMDLPIMTPWPGVARAHLARRRLWSAMDEVQTQLDKKARGEETDYSWGDLDDVSEMMLERNRIWRENGFDVKERGDLMVLWAVVVTIPYLAAWHILYILSTPTLLSSIREEISPYVRVTAPITIGNYSSPPALTISTQKMLNFCSLFRSSFRETLRLTSRDWMITATKCNGIDLARNKTMPGLHYIPQDTTIVIPHTLHLHDPKVFESPEHFIPDRFVVDDLPVVFRDKAGLFGASTLTEEVVLSFIAGVLLMWDIEPIVNERGRKEWKSPKMGYGNGVARPEGDVRVSIRSRVVDSGALQEE